MRKVNPDPSIEKPLLLPVERARTLVSLGRTKFLEMVKSGEIPSHMIGGRRLIPVAALERLASEGEARQ